MRYPKTFSAASFWASPSRTWASVRRPSGKGSTVCNRHSRRGMITFSIPYARHLLARVCLAAGDHARALDQLDAVLAKPYVVSPAWLRIDPTWAPLHGDPRFERLIAQPAAVPPPAARSEGGQAASGTALAGMRGRVVQSSGAMRGTTHDPRHHSNEHDRDREAERGVEMSGAVDQETGNRRGSRCQPDFRRSSETPSSGPQPPASRTTSGLQAYNAVELGPKQAPVRSRNTADATGGAQMAPTRHIAVAVWLATIAVLYARFGVAPAPIQRSRAQPPANAPAACIR